MFAAAARSFADLVRRIPDPAWSGPGLGEWDLRALVGHTSRSLITVSTYLAAPCDRQDVTSPEHYYVLMREVAATMGSGDILERGRQAGRDLGTDPAASVDQLVARALADVDAADNPLIAVIGGLGIRLDDYLPTRTFELAVHGCDIARATGVDFELPADVLRDAATLAARIAVATGDGEAVLMALTGRAALPAGFSAV